MKRVLVISYSQTGQLRDIAATTVAPLEADPNVDVTVAHITPESEYPFPWPFWQFFDTFPETVYEDVPPVLPLNIDPNSNFDLIILCYSVWFLSPSQPISAFLQTEAAAKLFNGKPVITVIGCRNMWLMAQERMKTRIEELGGHLIDNVVLTDDTHSAATFISTPMWMLTGNKGPFLGGRVPKAGVTQEDIDGCKRFGEAIARQLPDRQSGDTGSMLEGLGAVEISTGLMDSEKIAKKSFRLWGGLLRACGKPGTVLRRIVLGVYVLFLITLILTVVPLSAVLKKLLAPLNRAKVARQRAYFAAPSGESRHLMEV